ncbi:MAG: aroK [Firmicutes bacterium]|nr:aroK [Bacillota bacterium]
MKNIVLLGFMGTGKTSVGRLLARQLKRPFVDVDKMIEIACGAAISEIFQKHGEKFFREQESEMIAKAASYENAVIATGGGVVLNAENIARLRCNGVLVTLTASPEVILERTAKRTTRPLLNAPDREQTVKALLENREPLYQEADYIIDTTSGSLHQIAQKIIVLLRQGGHLRGRG